MTVERSQFLASQKRIPATVFFQKYTSKIHLVERFFLPYSKKRVFLGLFGQGTLQLDATKIRSTKFQCAGLPMPTDVRIVRIEPLSPPLFSTFHLFVP
jgi:hypothetical protein